MTTVTLAERFQLRRFGWRAGLATAGTFVVTLALTPSMQPTRSWILDLSSWFRPNDSFPPSQDPTIEGDSIDTIVDWMGPDAVGHWRWAILIVLLLFFNIAGEELLWRGVIWPRQELVYGGYTWLVHGFMWTMFHVPIYPWYLIFHLPTSLVLSYLMQRTRNTWLAIVLHTLMNGSFYVILLLVIAGVID